MSIFIKKHFFSLASQFCLAAFSSALLISANAYSAELEEIVITAQKRAQSLQDVPISAVVTTGESIRKNAISRLEDLTVGTPNVTVTQSALGDQLFIRGVGSGTNIGFEQSVGTFVDGVYLGRGLLTRNAFLDVERIEILRGPQSTFFGNNTVAGALSITNKAPNTEEWEGYALAAYEDGTDKGSLEVAYGGPVSDTFAFRIAAIYSDQDGWQTNSTIDEKEPQEEKKAIRGTALWTPSDNFSAKLTLQRELSSVDGRALQAVGCLPPDGQPPAGYCLAFGVIGNGQTPDFIFDDRRNGGNGTSPFPTDGDFNNLDTFSTNLALSWTLAEHEITWQSSYNEYTNHRAQAGILLAGPFPAAPLPFANIEQVLETFDQTAHELRIASPVGNTFEYIAGVYFQENDLRAINDFSAATFATRLSDHQQDQETRSIFGSVTWNINDDLRLTAGLRYTDVEKDVFRDQVLASNQGNLDLANAAPFLPTNPLFGAFVFGFGWQTGTIADSLENDELLPSLNVQYDISDSSMVYLSYAEGFKAGGFDEQNGRLDAASLSFEPESVTNYEVGLKSTLLDGSMRLNLAAFMTEFENLQVQTFDGIINFLVTSAAEATSQGLEAELVWQIDDAFRLDVQAAFLDAAYDSRTNAQCTTTQAAGLAPGCTASTVAGRNVFVQDLSGEPFPLAPDLSANIALTYATGFDNGFGLTSQLSASYEDDFFLADDNDPFLVQDAYVKINASVRITSPDESWEVALIGRNLNDERTSHQGTDLPLSSGTYFQFLDKPRTVALQGRYKF